MNGTNPTSPANPAVPTQATPTTPPNPTTAATPTSTAATGVPPTTTAGTITSPPIIQFDSVFMKIRRMTRTNVIIAVMMVLLVVMGIIIIGHHTDKLVISPSKDIKQNNVNAAMIPIIITNTGYMVMNGRTNGSFTEYVTNLVANTSFNSNNTNATPVINTANGNGFGFGKNEPRNELRVENNNGNIFGHVEHLTINNQTNIMIADRKDFGSSSSEQRQPSSAAMRKNIYRIPEDIGKGTSTLTIDPDQTIVFQQRKGWTFEFRFGGKGQNVTARGLRSDNISVKIDHEATAPLSTFKEVSFHSSDTESLEFEIITIEY